MKIGFIGLGTMGGAMALNLRKAGFDLVVHDLRPETAAPLIAAGAVGADSVAALGKTVDVVLTSLPGPREAEAVGAELMQSMKKGSVWFDLTTNSPTVVRALAARCAGQGITMLDAPVSGGPHGAKSGKMALLVGGDEAVFNSHRRVLDAIGD